MPIGNQEPLLGARQIGDSVGLPPEHPTIASLLKANGYDTALIGKWHCGYLPKYSPLQSGFNEFFGNFSGAIDYFRHVDTAGEPDMQGSGGSSAVYRLHYRFIYRPCN